MPSSYTLHNTNEYGSPAAASFEDKWPHRQQYTRDPVDQARARTSRSLDPVRTYPNVTLRLPRPPRLSFNGERDELQHDR